MFPDIITGGEPMDQADFACAPAGLLHREGIGTVPETCGHAPLGGCSDPVFL